MSRKCKHRYAVMLGRRRVTRVANRRHGWMYYLDCLCRRRGIGAIPMERANDDADAVRVEIRAAQIAADAETRAPRKFTLGAELRGWARRVHNLPPTRRAQLAGWLAAEIFYTRGGK